MEASSQARHSRLGEIRREGERVTPLELFFDLVFVLAIVLLFLIPVATAMAGTGFADAGWPYC